jgi:hypothetical protein
MTGKKGVALGVAAGIEADQRLCASEFAMREQRLLERLAARLAGKRVECDIGGVESGQSGETRFMGEALAIRLAKGEVGRRGALAVDILGDDDPSRPGRRVRSGARWLPIRRCRAEPRSRMRICCTSRPVSTELAMITTPSGSAARVRAASARQRIVGEETDLSDDLPPRP